MIEKYYTGIDVYITLTTLNLKKYSTMTPFKGVKVMLRNGGISSAVSKNTWSLSVIYSNNNNNDCELWNQLGMEVFLLVSFTLEWVKKEEMLSHENLFSFSKDYYCLLMLMNCAWIVLGLQTKWL